MRSPQVSWSAGSCQERLLGNGIFTAEILLLLALSFVSEQPIKRIIFFTVPEFLLATNQ